MGRVVRGASIAPQPYRLKAPPIPAPRPPAVSFDDEDPIFSEFHTPELHPPVAFDAPATVEHDVEAVRAQAQKLLDEASADAQALLEDARAKALELVEDAQRRAAEMQAQAKQQGFEEGRSDGRAAAQAEMDDMLETMRGLIEMARAERHKIVEDAEPEIVRLSVAIAERILTQQVAIDPDTVLEMVRSAISRLVNRETVTVRVNPADIATMREHREQLMSMSDIDNMRVIEDQRVDRGGVVIETEAGTIDAKISTQLREVRRLLAVEDGMQVGPPPERALLNPPAQAS